jgi:hypothetical protein
MPVAPPTSPYERFMEPSLHGRLVGSLQRRFGQRVGSDEVEDAYGHMLEKLSKMPVAEVEAVESPVSWMFVGMRNRLQDRLRLHSASTVRFGDLPDVNVIEDVLSDGDDVVVGSVIGRETAGEKLAQVAELVWLKFTGEDGQIAARILLEEGKPQAVAAELGLDPAYVSTVAHKAHQERRLLERKVKEDPEFRCWRLRKHTSNYYASGEVSLALRAHWITCSKCRGAQRVVRDTTYRALAPLLPVAALPIRGGLLARFLHHATHPVRTTRRLVRPAGHAGAKAGASSTQLGTVGATVTSKVAVVATVAVIGTGAAGATTIATVRHFTHHATRRALTHHRPANAAVPAAASSPAPTPTALPQTASQPQTVVHHAKQHVAKHVKKQITRAKRQRHRVITHVTKDVVTATSVVTQTATTPAPTPTPAPTTTAAAPAPTTPPATHTTAPTSPSSSGSVSNPSYATPNAP